MWNIAEWAGLIRNFPDRLHLKEARADSTNDGCKYFVGNKGLILQIWERISSYFGSLDSTMRLIKITPLARLMS